MPSSCSKGYTQIHTSISEKLGKSDELSGL